MSEQLLLFRHKKPAWIERFWETINPEKGQEAIAILARMASDALATRTVRREKERSDEP